MGSPKCLRLGGAPGAPPRIEDFHVSACYVQQLAKDSSLVYHQKYSGQAEIFQGEECCFAIFDIYSSKDPLQLVYLMMKGGLAANFQGGGYCFGIFGIYLITCWQEFSPFLLQEFSPFLLAIGIRLLAPPQTCGIRLLAPPQL